MGLIGCSKRAVVGSQARRFGNKRHTGTFPYLENIKAQVLAPLERKRFKSIRKKVERAGTASSGMFDRISKRRGGLAAFAR